MKGGPPQNPQMNAQMGLIPSLKEWCTFPENRLWVFKDVMFQVLAGVTRLGKILESLGAQETPENKRYLQEEIMNGEFHSQLEIARRDMVASVTDRLRERAHRYANKMESLLEAKEERTQYMAAKDLLDRAGTGAAQKITVSTPSQYRKVVEEFLVAEKAAEKGEGK